MRRFETSDGPRYVWAPEVHDALGEECHYYLLRAPDPETHVALTDELNKLLRREDITSHSIYAVFGYYDALIRLWATETVRRRFIRALVASSLKPEALEDLRASSIYYEFAQNKRTITAQEVRENEGPIRRVVEADVADSWDDDPAAVKAFDDLVSIGFIHEVPRTEGIKVYIAFARTRHLLGEHRDSEATGIISAMRTAGFSNVSLYSGSGTLGAHLVKGVSSSSFSSIWQMATAVHEFAATDGLRSMTMPIANMATVVESDTIDNVRIPARFEFDAIREELVRAARLSDEENEHLWAGLNALTKTEKDGLEHVYREAADKLRDTSYFDRVLEAIAGSLLNDADMIESSVAFVTKVEQLLRKVIPRLLVDSRGVDWFSTTISELEADDEGKDPLFANAKKSVDSMTLHGLFALARFESDRSVAVHNALAAALDEKWPTKVRRIETLRNDLAHGRLTDRKSFTQFDDTWGDQLLSMVDCALFVAGLSRLEVALS